MAGLFAEEELRDSKIVRAETLHGRLLLKQRGFDSVF